MSKRTSESVDDQPEAKQPRIARGPFVTKYEYVTVDEDSENPVDVTCGDMESFATLEEANEFLYQQFSESFRDRRLLNSDTIHALFRSTSVYDLWENFCDPEVRDYSLSTPFFQAQILEIGDCKEPISSPDLDKFLARFQKDVYKNVRDFIAHELEAEGTDKEREETEKAARDNIAEVLDDPDYNEVKAMLEADA